MQKLGSPAPGRGAISCTSARPWTSARTATHCGCTELKERDGEGNRQGENHIYARSANTFVYQTTLTIPHDEVDFCNSGKLSGDGQTFVQYCISYGPTTTAS